MTLITVVADSADNNHSRCKGCVFDFTDTDGYHQQCYEDRWIVGGCFVAPPCGYKKHEEINSNPNKVYLATLVFDAKAQAATLPRTGNLITIYVTGETFEEKKYDPWTDPAYQLGKMSWFIYQKSDSWVIVEDHDEGFKLYTDGDYDAMYAELMLYLSSGKLQFFNRM